MDWVLKTSWASSCPPRRAHSAAFGLWGRLVGSPGETEPGVTAMLAFMPTNVSLLACMWVPGEMHQGCPGRIAWPTSAPSAKGCQSGPSTSRDGRLLASRCR